MDNRQQLAQLIIDVIPKFMRSLASEWRHIEQTLTPGHFRVLFILAHGPQNLSDLATKLEVSLPTMSNSISTLCERDWVARHRDPEDRRRVLIKLTPEGFAVLDRIRQRAEKHLAKMLEPLSDSDCQHAVRGMEALQGLLLDQPTCDVKSASPLNEPSES